MGPSTGFGIRLPASGSLDDPSTHVSAWLKDTNHFQFCVRVLGTDGAQYVIVYKPTDGVPTGGGIYVWTPVGTQFKDGILRLRSGQARHHLDRDLEADLQAVYPTVGIQHVIRFGIRGDYDLDDLILYDENLSYLHADHPSRGSGQAWAPPPWRRTPAVA